MPGEAAAPRAAAFPPLVVAGPQSAVPPLVVAASAPAEDPGYLRRGRGPLRPLVPEGGVRVALVSTLRDVQDQLMVWLEWYRIV
eukprot:3384290-Heterocapsa_arctica.AAC.1